jgi:hypothetical protein
MIFKLRGFTRLREHKLTRSLAELFATHIQVSMHTNRADYPVRLLSGGLAERCHVDDEAKLDITLEKTLVGFINLIHANHLYLADDVVLSTKVQHLLRFRNTADVGAGERRAPQSEAEGLDCQRCFGKSHEHEGPVRLEQVEVGIDVVLCGYAIENEVE